MRCQRFLFSAMSREPLWARAETGQPFSVRERADRTLPGLGSQGLMSAGWHCRPRKKAARHARLCAPVVSQTCRQQTVFLWGHVELLARHVVDAFAGL